jgi:tetratricopeptide (TPR) repeat protein
MMTQCLEEENFRKKEIADAQSAYNAASSSFAKCQASLNAATKNLPSLKKALHEFEDNLAKKTAERKKQHGLYLQRRKDWTEAIDFLKEFISQVNTKLAKYPSFADLGEKLLRHVAKLGRMSEAVEVFVALAQAPGKDELSAGPGTHSNYSYKSQAKTVNSLRSHLTTLLNKLIVDSKQNDIDEAKAQAAFEKVKAELLVIINKLKKDITRTETQITNMRACVANEGKIMATANSKLSRNSKLKDLAGKTCTDFTKEFISATKNRLSEMEVISQILTIMKRRFKNLPKDLLDYLRATKTGFKIYINSTQFIKYQEYVQKHIADNLAGKKLVGH